MIESSPVLLRLYVKSRIAFISPSETTSLYFSKKLFPLSVHLILILLSFLFFSTLSCSFPMTQSPAGMSYTFHNKKNDAENHHQYAESLDHIFVLRFFVLSVTNLVIIFCIYKKKNKEKACFFHKPYVR